MSYWLYSLAVALTLPLLSCTREEQEGHTHKTRLEAFWDRGALRELADTAAPVRSTRTDTLVYVCGVEFDQGYDWRHDSAYGTAGGRLVLFNGSERILEIPSDSRTVSLDPDLHHLREAHIYTEGCTAASTVIGRDGQTLFSYEGREVLRGLLIEGEDIYTLGQSRSGQGFSLRCNGELICSSADGVVSGEMSDSPEYPSGALYRDEGHLYFSYSRPVTASGSARAWFVVEDGRETQILSDMDGAASYDIRVTDGEVSIEKREVETSRRYDLRSGDFSSSLLIFDDGTFSLHSPLAVIERRFSRTYYIFSWRVAAQCGSSCFMAVTPSDEGAAPYLWRDGSSTPLPLNGFLTAVEVIVVEKD